MPHGTRRAVAVLGAVLVAFALGSGVAAEEEAAPPVIRDAKALAALDPDTRVVRLRYWKGALAALHERCPAVEHLSIEEHGGMPTADVAVLTRFEALTHLVIFGDLGFPTEQFEIVGSLAKLRRLELGLA